MARRDVDPDEMPHDRLDAFLDELHTTAAEAPVPVVGDALATLFRDGQASVAAPTPVKRRRRWSARAAVAGAVAGVTFGGLGIAGALPAPVQRGVADVVRQVGIELPDAEPAPTTTTTVPTTTTTETPTTSAPSPSSTVPERGNSEEHRQDDRNDNDNERRGNSDEHRQDDVDDRGEGRNPSAADDVHRNDANRGGPPE